jgi:hypothetical protein
MQFSSGAFSTIGGGVSDLFAAQGARSKAQGDYFEAQEYDLAARYADQEAEFTKESTAIQAMQSERATYQSMSQTRADVGGAGFAASGSGLDILAQSASQGALQKAVLERQGLIQEQGYLEQAQSFRMMESAAEMAGNAEKKAAIGDEITGGLKIATGLASMIFTGGVGGSEFGPALGGLVGMPEGEGGGFLGGFGGAG